MGFQYIINRERKIQQRPFVVFAPLAAQKVIEIKVCDHQGISAKLRFEQLLGGFYRWVKIRKVINFPVQINAPNDFWFKAIFYIPTNEVTDEVPYQDLRMIKGQIGMGKKIHGRMLFRLYRNTYILVKFKC